MGRVAQIDYFISTLEELNERAFAIYEKLAEAGNADGMYNCGVMFDSGVGVEKDLEKAREYFEMAASMGSEQAANVLEKLG